MKNNSELFSYVEQLGKHHSLELLKNKSKSVLIFIALFDLLFVSILVMRLGSEAAPLMTIFAVIISVAVYAKLALFEFIERAFQLRSTLRFIQEKKIVWIYIATFTIGSEETQLHLKFVDSDRTQKHIVLRSIPEALESDIKRCLPVDFGYSREKEQKYIFADKSGNSQI